MRRLLFPIALFAALAASPARPQPDGMEMQRCVWRCLAESRGADDPAYNACVAAQCSEIEEAVQDPVPEPAIPEPPAAEPPARGAASAWIYADHPLLGRGAFVAAPKGVIGLACGQAGQPLDLRMTNGFFQGPVLTVMFDGPDRAYSVAGTAGQASQVSGTACVLGLEAFRQARSLYLVDGEITGTVQRVTGTQVQLRRGTLSATATGGLEAYRQLGGTEVTLDGSSEAIERMLADCPAAKTDAELICR